MFYRFVVGAVRVLLKLLYRVEYDGQENIPDDGGFIIVSNHRSYWDPFIVAMTVVPHRLAIMAKKELFRIPVVSNFIRYFGAFPVDRGAGDTGALDHAVQAVKNGEVMIIFPEGTRARKPELLRFKSGAAHIISSTGGNVLPLAIDFRGKLRFGKRVKVHVGRMMTQDELGLSGEYSLSSIRKATRMLHERVDSMLVLCRDES